MGPGGDVRPNGDACAARIDIGSAPEMRVYGLRTTPPSPMLSTRRICCNNVCHLLQLSLLLHQSCVQLCQIFSFSTNLRAFLLLRLRRLRVRQHLMLRRTLCHPRVPGIGPRCCVR